MAEYYSTSERLKRGCGNAIVYSVVISAGLIGDRVLRALFGSITPIVSVAIIAVFPSVFAATRHVRSENKVFSRVLGFSWFWVLSAFVSLYIDPISIKGASILWVFAIPALLALLCGSFSLGDRYADYLDRAVRNRPSPPRQATLDPLPRQPTRCLECGFLGAHAHHCPTTKSSRKKS